MKTLENNTKYWLEGDNEPAFLYAKSIIDHHAKSFSFASKFIPEQRRWATYATYSFCRYADNIVDNPRDRSKQEIINELNEIRNEIDFAYKYGESEHPVLKSFIIAAKMYDIPKQYTFDLLDGVEMDLTIDRYKTFDELYLFCYRVASVVGLMMTYVLGFKDDKTLKYAEEMGIAMQLTNILRDIKEDKNMGRIYLPIDEIKQFHLKESDFFSENFNLDFRNFMQFQVDRAKSYYQDSTKGISMLEHESRFSIYAAGRIYSDILRKIEERGYNPFLGRVFVPKSEKISILIQEFVKRNVLNINND